MDCTDFIRGEVCMVTGGGGSIGGELVRRLFDMGASKIVIVDVYENGAYYISREIPNSIVEIASVCDKDKMDHIVSAYRPRVIFHAAAHKHVPFMEACPEEAVKNNIIGTLVTARAALKYGAEKFILISTDKAVEPISVMGASKRVCEMILYALSKKTDGTSFTTVRFGNVLSSEGSVIPLFKKQIERGTVTVTDAEATRYFMTIPQAAKLLTDSLSISCGGDIFIPKMGESKNILSIAEETIRAAGKRPYDDVKIKFIGLRAGDKLHEKLFYDFEKPQSTKFDNILRVEASGIKDLEGALCSLNAAASRCEREKVRELILKTANSAPDAEQ